MSDKMHNAMGHNAMGHDTMGHDTMGVKRLNKRHFLKKGIFYSVLSGVYLMGGWLGLASLHYATAAPPLSDVTHQMTTQMTHQAADMVREMGGKVFKIVLDQSTGEDEKEHAFIGLLNQYFDMDEIAKYLMGARIFKTLTPDQKTRYQKALKFYIAHLYLVKFETYQRHDFDPKIFHVGRAVAKGDKKGSFSVQSTINVSGSSGQEPLEVEWTVVPSGVAPGNVPGGTLKIQDAYVAGISMLITKKDEFKSIIAQGVETFLSKLEDMAHH